MDSVLAIEFGARGENAFFVDGMTTNCKATPPRRQVEVDRLHPSALE
jgi:hypothetical protein